MTHSHISEHYRCDYNLVVNSSTERVSSTREKREGWLCLQASEDEARAGLTRASIHSFIHSFILLVGARRIEFLFYKSEDQMRNFWDHVWLFFLYF